MANFEICSDKRFANSLEYIKKKLCDCEVVTEGFRTTLKICKDDNKTCNELIDALADIIITDCKSHYINERIRLPIGDPVLRHAFICALITFDHDTDKIIAKTLIRLTKQFNLDSFFDFCLDVLKNRWDEVCNLANENIHYLVCQKTFMELLQFLISNIDCKMDDTIFMHIHEQAVREDVKKFFGTCVVNN